jgi:hypothetical protein
MDTRLDELERDLLHTLLEGDDPVLAVLRQQLESSTRQEREMSGVGFFRRFAIAAEVAPLKGRPSFTFGDIQAEINGLARGAGFLLFVAKGFLDFLEAYTYDEGWPACITGYRISHISGAIRDMRALRATPGWPEEGTGDGVGEPGTG